ncbi:centrosomal protein of 152 kDa isoform X2 [Venturia canescens]|uniref:centrosomal protein of 152 kDa isoform X2 n=1 Tax=Venturia canescens TaxID=32260 RepID=UPI001C9BC1ED|nr:centrosomal protein of 152 kDa isoform X2 [Venturia canescens]
MEAPGLSLFQGSDSIQLNSNTQRQQEEEEQEDLKRRNEEIKDLLANAFDDLEDEDDASSVNSSHFQDVTRDVESSSIIENSSGHLIQNDKGPTISHYQNEFGIYGQNESNNYNQNSLLSEPEAEKGPTISDIQREYGLYPSDGTPCSNNNKGGPTTERSVDSPYELPRPPNSNFGLDRTGQVNEFYVSHDNYPFNYETPSNHYDAKGKTCRNNGYISPYENNVQGKDYGGGGDNDANSEHFNHCFKTSPNGQPLNDNNAYKAAEYNSKEQLEVLYSVRMREIQQLTEELQQLYTEKENEKDQMGRKLALAQAEIERSNLSRNQAQNALVDAKAEIVDLQTQVTSLKENVAVLEKTNQNLSHELTVARDSVIDLQQKIAVLERVQTLHANDKTQEKFLKQAQEKHGIEIRNMQTQIDLLTDKLNVKESSYVSLEQKLADVRRAHETLMVEKADTVNRLSQALEDSQTQCRNLMASNQAQEMMQLQARVKILTREKEELQSSVHDLQHKLEAAKNDAMQYDSLLATSLEDESDSIRQLKLGDPQNRSRGKGSDDVANKLRGELQRCLAGQAVKRKEIHRLENTLSQKDKELSKAMEMAATCQQEAARYAKRVSELEHELKAVLTEHTVNANAQIQKLSDHLTEVKTHYGELREEKLVLEKKLEETLNNQQETLRKLHQESMAEQQKEMIDEYNKEYLDIHEKAVERVRQEAQLEIVQLTVQLEQTQKELDRVKELYIEVCGTKEQLISDHRNEIRLLKEEYANLESQKEFMDKMKNDLEVQVKIVSRLTKESESYKAQIIELEKDLNMERKKKEEYTKKIHDEIERAKEEALAELRSAHPDQQISVVLPDYCSEHSDKIARLENDCKRLEEKLSLAVEEQREMSDLQTKLDDTKLKVAQMEIAQESLRKKYDNVVSERNDLLSRISTLEMKLSETKNSERRDSEDIKSKISRIQLDNDTLRQKCESLLKEKIEYKEKISKLRLDIAEKKKTIGSLESILNRSGEKRSSDQLENTRKELSRYKELVEQLSSKTNEGKDKGTSSLFLEERVKQLEMDLAAKELKLQKLKDMEKIKEERNQLLIKLKNQAKQFEQYVKSQKRMSAELNLSPRSSADGTEMQRLREIATREVREEMEQKVAKELRLIEDQHREKQKSLEEKYKSALIELHTRCNEKTKEIESLREAVHMDKVKLHTSLKAQEKIVAQMIDAKLDSFNRELAARKLKIEELQEKLQQKENDTEEERNVWAQQMSEWLVEIRDIKSNEEKMTEEIKTLKEVEKCLTQKIKTMMEKEVTLNSRLKSAKKTALNWKERAEKTDKFLSIERKRIEENYERAMKLAQEKIEAIISAAEEHVAVKLKEVEVQYEEQLEQMRLKMKYKNKC